MSTPTSPAQFTSPTFPQPRVLTAEFNSGIHQSASPPLSSAASASSLSESEQPGQLRPFRRKSRAERPMMGERQRSQSIIIPKGGDNYQKEKPNYPPDDARTMSPRRNSHELERLEKNARQSIKDKARTLQSSLAALAERIDEVKSDHDKLESENKFLQDYIGGLTRTMSRDGIGSAGKKSK